MDRLRTILILRGLLAAFFAVLGVVLIVGGDAVFGVFAVAVGVVNAVLITVLVRRARRAG
jgi:drug/metabolite transporter (DMT)-like permease